MLGRLYAKWGMDDDTDFQPLSPRDYPVLSDLYDVIEEAYRNYDSEEYPLYPRELLQEVLLGLHSMCRGAESKFFNGHTNITTSRFLVFGVKGLLQASRNVKNACCSTCCPTSATSCSQRGVPRRGWTSFISG